MCYAIVTKWFAPYRFELYEGVRSCCPCEVYIFLAHSIPPDQPWLVQPASIFKGKIFSSGRGLSGIRALISGLENTRPPILFITEFSLFSVMAMIWARIRRVPFVIATDLGYDPPVHAKRWYGRYWQALWRREAAGIVAQTPDALRAARHDKLRHFFLPHSTSLSRFSQLSKDQESGKRPLTILFVGRIEAAKGVLDLIQAGVLLSAQTHLPEWRIRLVGSGELDEEVSSLAENFGWMEVVGFREGVALLREYQSADIFVLPTHADTYGVVVHEAACAGLPLVVSTAAGASEILVEGLGSGIAVKPKAPQMLATALGRLLLDSELRQRCSIAARQVGERFSVETLAPQLVRWLEHLRAKNDFGRGHVGSR